VALPATPGSANPIQRYGGHPSLSPSTSLFLDLLRIIAAGLVFAGHCAQFWCNTSHGPGHQAVVIFFVLSGFVITWSTGRSHRRDVRRYASARLARLYSVVIPAILLTIVVQYVGKIVNPQYYLALDRGHEPLRWAMTGAFVQNVWFLSASPATNTPFWSLSYEFAYYALFGAAVFARTTSWRIFLLLAIAAVAGPNIILLFPCWLAGALVCAFPLKAPARLAILGFTLATAAALLAAFYLPEYPAQIGYRPLFFSGAFLTDWLLALLIAAAIWCFAAAFPAEWPPNWLRRVIRYGADHTFSLYLYHYPLIIFVAAIWSARFNAYSIALFALAVVTAVFLFSLFTESKRDVWRRIFDRILVGRSPDERISAG
jgi:peptidoglycan/LPS O-acetylase OafA/YrhL